MGMLLVQLKGLSKLLTTAMFLRRKLGMHSQMTVVRAYAKKQGSAFRGNCYACN